MGDHDSLSEDEEEVLVGGKRRGTRSGTDRGGDVPPAVGGTPTDPARGVSPITTMDMSSVAARSNDSNYSLVETNDQIRIDGHNADHECGDGGDSDDEGLGYMAPEDIEYEMIQTENERVNCDSYDIEHHVTLQEDGWNEKTISSWNKLI